VSAGISAYADGYGESLDWGFITENVLAYAVPDEFSLRPTLQFRESTFLDEGDASPEVIGTPWGYGGWDFDDALWSPIPWVEWDTSGNNGLVVDVPQGMGFTIVCLFRPDLLDVNFRRLWMLETSLGWWTDVSHSNIKARSSLFIVGVGTDNLTANVVMSAGEWYAFGVCFGGNLLAGRKLMMTATDGSVHPATAESIWGFNLGQGIDTIYITHTLKASVRIDGTIGGWMLTKGQWDETQFLRWASDPYQWYEIYNQRGLNVPGTCPQAKAKVRQAVDGSIAVAPAVSGTPSVAIACDGEPSVYPTVSATGAKVRPATSGTARICGED
jgi:hypothetical protein